MTTAPLALALEQLRTLADPTPAAEADHQLLDRYAGGRDESAFSALLVRHGPMVLGVCRRLLGNEQDAEDAFQATFLVLAQSAGCIRKRDSVAAWLHGVAQRIARKTQRARARRQQRERRAARREARPGLEVATRELEAVLDEELAGLPGHYRAALLLCYFEGQTVEEAARQLSCPRGTVASRLAQGRTLLRTRLARRGVDLSAGALAALLLAGTAPAAVPAALLAATRVAVFAPAAG